MKPNIFFGIVAGMMALVLCNTSTYATKYSVDVRDFEFSPSDLPNVRVGDTIRWEWKDGFHTTTSTTIPSGAAAWNHTISSTNQSFDYIPTVVGIYNYVCTPHASQGMVGSFTVSSPAGISDGLSPVSIKLYPNPFTDKINLRVQSSGDNRIEKLQIYDVTGKMISEYSFGTTDGLFEKEILFSSPAAGVLFFEFYDRKGTVLVRRVIRE